MIASSEATDIKSDGSTDDTTSLLRSKEPAAIKGNDRTIWIALLITVLGAGVSGAFMALGITGSKDDTKLIFEKQANDLVRSIEAGFNDFQTAGLMIHQTCNSGADQSTEIAGHGVCSRHNFADLYRYIVASGLEFQAAAWIMNVTNEERPVCEAESEFYYRTMGIPYDGFIGFEPDPEDPMGFSVQNRSEAPYYYIVHHIAPLAGDINLAALDFDVGTSDVRRNVIEKAIATGEATMTPKLKLILSEADEGHTVVLCHPGVMINHHLPLKQGVAFMVVRINFLLTRVMEVHRHLFDVYLYDCTDNDSHDESMKNSFLGAVRRTWADGVTLLTELTPDKVHNNRALVVDDTIHVADRTWRIVVAACDGAYEPDTLFVVLGGCIIFISCICLSIWFYTSSRSAAKMNAMSAAAEAEKTALILANAEKETRLERDLNDFLAHEVRNPLSAAISANTFVATELEKESFERDPKAIKLVKDDLQVIDSSLHFINDLLRNLLEVHRTQISKAKVVMVPTDIYRDVLSPVTAILRRRGDMFRFIVDCEPNLIYMTDSMRLKQIVLNLANNSRKFVQTGFIRLAASAVNGKLRICVEDSGPGIPIEKRGKLFVKFQESLDSLNQGTGIGLSLCHSMVQVLNGTITHDDSFDSGVAGNPGTRFVIDIDAAPVDISQLEESAMAASESASSLTHSQPPDELLPLTLSVLFVDDDTVLRKLFVRSVKRIRPEWSIEEAASGEACLSIIDSEGISKFDLIFLDQYMASYEKQLLGTETARSLRVKGVKSKICGLSANDTKQAFLEAGADAFLLKPFPCKKDELSMELVRILDLQGASPPESHPESPV